MPSRGFFKMSDNENISACEVRNSRTLNEKDVNKKNEQRFALTTETELAYSALKLYLSRINPACEALFQYPKRNWKPTDEIWYEIRPLGVNKLGDMMKDISTAASLSKIYTNHSVRATSITLWSNAGFTNRHIMQISGHRNEQSLQHYNRRPFTSQLKRCSDVLSEALGNETGHTDEFHSIQRRRTVQAFQATKSNSSAVSTITTSLSSISSVQIKNLPNFASMFSGCSIGNVHVNFNTPK